MTVGLTERFDLLRGAIGLFVTVGLALTALAGYVLLDTLNVTVTVGLAVSVLSGASLVAVVVVVTTWLRSDTGRRTRRRSA